MVTSIQLGNIFTAGDRRVLTGGNSGLDIEALVTSLADAKRQPAVVLEDKLEVNASRVEAYGELKEIFGRYRSAVDLLRNPPGVQNADKNLFKYRAAELSSNQGLTATDYLTVTSQPGAPVGSHVVENVVPALETIQLSDDILVADATTASVVSAGATANRFTAGVMTLNNGATVTLDAGDTLNEVVSKINNVKGTSGIEASLIKQADGVYTMVLRGTETGATNGFNVMVVANTGVGQPLESLSFATTQTAADASFDIDGVTITRSSNVIDDVLDNTTFTLRQTTAAMQEIALDITPDAELIRDGIVNFVDAYNEFRIFSAKQTELGDNGRPKDTALLFSDSSFRAIINRIAVEMSRAVEGIAAADPDNLAALGIKFTDFEGDDESPFTRNILTVDPDTLLAKIQGDFDAVRRVFEFDMVTDSSKLQVFSRTNALDVSSFTLNIDTGTGTYTADYLDEDSNPQTAALDGTVNNGILTLRGQDGTVLEGLVLLYDGTGTDTVSVGITQGIGDRVFNALEGILDSDDGTVTLALDALNQRTEDMQEEIDRIDAQVERYRDQLIEKFSGLEAALASVNSLLQALDAQAQAQANN